MNPARSFADIVQGADTRMIQPRNALRLALKAFEELRVCGQVGRQDFDGDDAFQADVAGLVNLAHTASANRGHDFIRAEFVPGVRSIASGWWLIYCT